MSDLPPTGPEDSSDDASPTPDVTPESTPDSNPVSPPAGPADADGLVVLNEDGAPIDARGVQFASRVTTVVIQDEMKASYLDYAMSVIVGRALPDVRDGLKPVHRRILFSMDETGLRPTSPYRKCASAVGDVMKKYHPHGDSAIYDALVRMGQDFSIRYELIDGHGNFGSVDGDPAAAMRYTESRLSKLAMELLRDINEETVDFVPNYDGYEQEPVVLPARFPNLLANGATGIAVGMATNIPPHNLGELIDATIALINNPDLTSMDLMEYVPAPDFPTGGLILGQAGAHEAFTTGRGSVRVRSVCEIEDSTDRKGAMRIVVTEIPYMVNKAKLLEKIARLVNDRSIAGIADLRDESSREGMRMVIELKRDANPQVVLNLLYKHTQLQDSFGVNCLALVDGVPKTLTLQQCLTHYITHQVEVIERRTRYRLRKAKDRAHVVEGLLVALDHIDEVIAVIRASESADAARGALMERFTLSEIQSQAILDMQLRRLAALERQKLQDEYDDLMRIIDDLMDILADPTRVQTIIIEEMTEIRDKFSDPRRSRIIPDDGEMTVEDLIPVTDVVVTLTQGGYIKRTPQEVFRTQKRGGVGVRGTSMRDDDIVSVLLTCSSHDHLLFFTSTGRMHRIKTYLVPEKSRDAKGVYVANVTGLALEPDEKVAAVLPMKAFGDQERFVTFATRNGTVKRTPLEDFDSPRSTLIAINLADDDELIGVAITSGDDDIVLVSKGGKAIRFHETDARSMGRNAGGVRGMRLTAEGDAVLSMSSVEQATDSYLLVVTRSGYGKRTPVQRFRIQGRGGQGLKAIKLVGDREVAGALVVPFEGEILLMTNTGTVIRMDVADIAPKGRDVQGVRVMRPGDDAEVVGIALVVDNDDEDDERPTRPDDEVIEDDDETSDEASDESADETPDDDDVVTEAPSARSEEATQDNSTDDPEDPA